VRDGGAEGSFRRELRVDVDPLAVAGRVGERVDLLLRDRMPVAVAEVLTDGVAQLLQ
jgi:hypothetical protein